MKTTKFDNFLLVLAGLFVAASLILGVMGMEGCSGKYYPGNNSKYNHFGSKHRVESKDSTSKK